ncbi:MAG: hypothetical protein GY738_10945 [Pseudoalteromonas sp.]|nr:hypothetical protein [Pseudoalteromonas sp.]
MAQKELLRAEEKELKRYAKKLGYNKRKSKSLPKVFVAEGLDCTPFSI